MVTLANEENLKKGEPFRFRSGEQAAEAGRKGGIKSGETRRKQRTMRQAAKMMLDMPVKGYPELVQRLKGMGISEEDLTFQMAVMSSMMAKAMQGNTKAAAFLRDTAGENPSLEIRREELEYRKAEFEYKRQLDEELRKKEESTSTLADVIEEAYRNRMEGVDDAE